MNGNGSASGNLAANIVVVFLCLVISAILKFKKRTLNKEGQRRMKRKIL
jgi:transposase